MIPKQFRNLPIHLILILAVIIFAFPVYFAFIGSTWDAGTIGRGQMPLNPGPYLVENYTNALTSARGERIIGYPVQVLLWNSLLMALTIAIGKIVISILSAYAVAFFRFPLRMFFFAMIFLDVDVAHRSSHRTNVQSDERFGTHQHVCRLDNSLDGVCHRHAPVSPILFDDSRRVRRGGKD